MNVYGREHVERVVRWIAENKRHVFVESNDFRLALAALIVTSLLAAISADLRDRGIGILITEAALGVAVLGVVLTALAILVGLLDQHYLQILERVDESGRLEPAFQPYRITATVAGTASLVALLSAAGWHVSIGLPVPWLFRALSLGLSSALCVWAIVGTVQLVDLTAFHGAQRGYLMRGIREARRQAEEKKSDAG